MIIRIPKEVEVVKDNGKIVKETQLFYVEVSILKEGFAFGELALIDNKPRAATIKCKENTHFAVLDKVHFDRILKVKE